MLCIQVPTSEISCPLKKSWKLRWRSALIVMLHVGEASEFESLARAAAEFFCSITPLELFHILRAAATHHHCRKRNRLFRLFAFRWTRRAADYFSDTFPQLAQVIELELPSTFDTR